MKKVLAILFIAGALTACNDDTSTDVKVSDSTSTTVPSVVDTSSATIDTLGGRTDTIGKPADSLKK